MLVYRLRWDHADLSLYRDATGCYLPLIVQELSFLENNGNVSKESMECVYRRLVEILSFCSGKTIPLHKKNFFQVLVGSRARCLERPIYVFMQ